MRRWILIACALFGAGFLAALPAGGAEPRLSAADQQVFRQAFREIEAKRYQLAERHASKGRDALAQKLVQWQRLIADPEGAGFAEVTRFLQANPDWPRLHRLLETAETAMPADLPFEEALAWFESHPPRTPAGAQRHAAALEAAGQHSQALALLRRAWVAFDFSAEDEKAFLDAVGARLTKGDQIARLDRLLWERRLRDARRQAARVGSGYAALAEARLRLATRRKGVDRSIERVPAELQNDPGLIYDRIRWRYRQGDYEGVVELLEPLPPGLPHATRWWPLRHWAARQALTKKHYETAYRLARNHDFTAGLGFAEGEWLAGWIALRFLEDGKAAYQHFTRLFHKVSTPVSLSRGAYWAGEAARAKGERSWSQHWYRLAAEHPSTYYGQRAAEKLGQAPNITLEQQLEPDTAARATFAQNELVQAVQILGELEQPHAQTIFLASLRARASGPVDYALVAELARELGRPDQALRAAKEARNGNIILTEDLYPLPELTIFGDLDPQLVLSLVRQESEFYSKAVSHAGARGLMQLMPATAKRVARSLKVKYRKSKLTADPDFNLRLGQAYLQDLLERFDGSALLALAAYNAGPSRVDRWIEEFGDPRTAEIHPVDWAEHIPYAETRNYVQRILETLPVYALRLAQVPKAATTDWDPVEKHSSREN